MPLEGEVSDSRLIGQRLYCLTTRYFNEAGAWAPESLLQTIDLTDPGHPVVLTSLRFASQASALQAAGRHLLVSSIQGWWWSGGEQSEIHLVDIGGAKGAPVLKKSLPLKGAVQDKFKMAVVNGAVVAATQEWTEGRRRTWVETFPLAGTRTAPLARLEIEAARDEQLYATRFDGNRLYLVTFRNTDPLFVVDLADPGTPNITGALEIPGWSTYIEPLGDRLLAVGVESGRVAVSLFDVADSAAPALRARLALGAEGTWSWSEATYDEKAVEYFPEARTVLVPFQNYTADGHIKAIQAIRVGRDTLTTAATIEHSFDPRRGAVLGEYFVSISGQELLVVNPKSQEGNAPLVQMSLAWTTDRVVPLGDYLVQVEDGSSGYASGPWVRIAAGGTASRPAMIRVSRASDPDDLVTEIELEAGRVVGMAGGDGRLYVSQWIAAAGDESARLLTQVFDLNDAPDLPQLASVEHPMAAVSNWELDLDQAELLWTGASTLAWYAPKRRPWNRWWWGPITLDAPMLRAAKAAPTVVAPASESANASALTAVVCPIRVDSDGPVALPQVRIETQGEFRVASRAFGSGGFLFFSFDTATPTVESDKADPGTTAVIAPWMPQPETLHSWLQVLDLRAPTSVVRDPVSIPGELLSLAQADAQGAVLITNTERSAANGAQINRTLQASAYDGVTAYLLDTLVTSAPFGAASASDGVRVYLAKDSADPGVLAIGYDPTSGRLAQSAAWDTQTPDTLHAVKGYLLSASSGSLAVARRGAAGTLTPVGLYAIPTNLWLRLAAAVTAPDLGIWIPAGEYGVEFLPWVDLRVSARSVPTTVEFASTRQ